MTTPIVIEITRPPEPASRDTFIDDLCGTRIATTSPVVAKSPR